MAKMLSPVVMLLLFFYSIYLEYRIKKLEEKIKEGS